jgi:hypothetical protein
MSSRLIDGSSQMSKSDTSYRLQIVPELIEPNFRATTFGIVNSFVNQQRIWMETMRMDPATLLVYMIVALAAVQKITRLSDIPQAMRGLEPLPQHLVGCISRRAVAASSGIPREQVRRIINELLESGRLVSAERGAVRVARDNARGENFTHIPSLLLVDIVRMVDDLRRLGVVVDQSPAANSASG